MLSRRRFNLGLATLAFAGLPACTSTPRGAAGGRVTGYGPLIADPVGLLDLPRGFSYRIVSRHGDRMDDDLVVPSHADGMGAFPLDRDRTILVRNHELRPSRADRGAFVNAGRSATEAAAFDRVGDRVPCPGGTTTLIYNQRSGRVESQYLSLAGTLINCAGGTTPWGSWLSCEEEAASAGTYGLGQDHGWVFEVPSRHRGLVDPVPLRAMGRFQHEAAAVDPRTGIVYLTEDQGDGLFYRFLPHTRGELARGGRLQALAFVDGGTDSRNWASLDFPIGTERQVRWIDLDNIEAPEDDLRKRGHAAGAAIFARGEGLCFGDGDFYFTCTSGGAAKLGQVMRYRPSRFEGQSGERSEPGRLQNFVESTSPDMLNYGDNLIVAPTGHLIVCEDQSGDAVTNHLRGITPDGRVYSFALLHAQTELAGVCFSGDGQVMFVNLYHPGRTVAITGPWRSFSA